MTSMLNRDQGIAPRQTEMAGCTLMFGCRARYAAMALLVGLLPVSCWRCLMARTGELVEDF